MQIIAEKISVFCSVECMTCLHEFLSFIQDSIPEKSREGLTALAAGMITEQSTHEKRHRFQFKVVRDLHPTLQNESEESGRLVVQLGKALLRNSYVSEFHDELNQMFEFAKMEPEKFMMVTLIGECIARPCCDNHPRNRQMACQNACEDHV